MSISKHIAVLDMGTSGIRILVAKSTDGRTPQIIAKKECECSGNAKGLLEDPDSVTKAISSLLDKIKQSTGLVVKSLYVSIPSGEISFVKNEAEADYGEEKDFTNKDVGTILDTVTDVDIYENEKLIGVSPIQYSIDGGEPINNPVGMTGTRLKVFANVVLANKEYTDKVKACLWGAGVETNGFIPLCLAMKWYIENNCTEESVLSVDIGDTLTEYTVYFRGLPFTTGMLPIGGDFIGSDISMVYKIPKQDADVLKVDWGAATTEVLGENVDIKLKTPAEDGRETIQVEEFVQVIEARINDTLQRILQGVYENRIDPQYIDCVVLSGNGMANYKGIESNVQKIMSLPVKEIDFGRSMGMKSCFTYASGMVLYVASQLPFGLHSSTVVREEPEDAGKKKSDENGNKFKDRLKKVFPGYRG